MCVNTHTHVEVALPVWLLSCMSPEVAGQVGRAREYFSTISRKDEKKKKKQ